MLVKKIYNGVVFKPLRTFYKFNLEYKLEELKKEFACKIIAKTEIGWAPDTEKEMIDLLAEFSNRLEKFVSKGVSQPVQTAGQWVLEIDNENEQYKILTKEKILPVDGKPNQEQQWIASVYCINDAAEIIINHNEKVGDLSC